MKKLPLDDSVLNRRNLIGRIENISFENEKIKLVPLEVDRDAFPLYTVSNGSKIEIGSFVYPEYDDGLEIWDKTPMSPFKNFEEFKEYIVDKANLKDGITFCIFNKTLNHQVGLVGYRFYSVAHLSLTIGTLWVSPISRNQGIATQAAYFLVDHAFRIGFRRIEWMHKSFGTESWKVAVKLGFKQEIVILEYSIDYKGRPISSMMHRILDYEWENLKKS